MAVSRSTSEMFCRSEKAVRSQQTTIRVICGICDCVRVCVRALKGKRLELTIPQSVQIYSTE